MVLYIEGLFHDALDLFGHDEAVRNIFPSLRALSGKWRLATGYAWLATVCS